MLTLESGRIFRHFAATVLRHACWIEYPVVVLYAGYVPVEEEEMVLIRVVLVCEALADLAYQVQITISLSFLSGLASVLVLTVVLTLVVNVGGTSIWAIFALIRL